MLSLIGACAFVFFFGGMLRANARRWRQLAKSYAHEVPVNIEKRSMQSAVLVSSGGFNSLKGILTIGANDKGVSLRVMTPFSLFHEPLFVPYGDIQGWQTRWYLDTRSIELNFRRDPDIKIVMSAEQAEWIQGFAGHKMTLHGASSPQPTATKRWHAFKMVHAAISLVMVGWLLLNIPI